MIRLHNRQAKVGTKFLLALGVLGALLYPILIDPFRNIDKFRDMQRDARKNIRREDIQPGNMNIWRDPFAPDPKK